MGVGVGVWVGERPHLLPEVDVENLSGEVEVDVGVVGVVPRVGDGQVEGHVLHPSQGQVRLAEQPDGSRKKTQINKQRQDVTGALSFEATGNQTLLYYCWPRRETNKLSPLKLAYFRSTNGPASFSR